MEKTIRDFLVRNLIEIKGMACEARSQMLNNAKDLHENYDGIWDLSVVEDELSFGIRIELQSLNMEDYVSIIIEELLADITPDVNSIEIAYDGPFSKVYSVHLGYGVIEGTIVVNCIVDFETDFSFYYREEENEELPFG